MTSFYDDELTHQVTFVFMDDLDWFCCGGEGQRFKSWRGSVWCDDQVLCDVRESWPESEHIPWAVTDREMFSSGLTLTQWTWRHRRRKRPRWSRCQWSRRYGGSRRRSTRWRKRTASFIGGRCGGRLQRPLCPENWQVRSPQKVCWEVRIRKLKDTNESLIVMLSQFSAAVKV